MKIISSISLPNISSLFDKENPPSFLTDRKIAVLAVLAFGIIASLYMGCRYFFKAEKNVDSPEKIGSSDDSSSTGVGSGSTLEKPDLRNTKSDEGDAGLPLEEFFRDDKKSPSRKFDKDRSSCLEEGIVESDQKETKEDEVFDDSFDQIARSSCAQLFDDSSDESSSEK